MAEAHAVDREGDRPRSKPVSPATVEGCGAPSRYALGLIVVGGTVPGRHGLALVTGHDQGIEAR